MNCREIFRYLFSEEAEQYFPDGCSHSEVFFLRTEGRKTYAFLLCQPEGEPGTEKARIYARIGFFEGGSLAFYEEKDGPYWTCCGDWEVLEAYRRSAEDADGFLFTPAPTSRERERAAAYLGYCRQVFGGQYAAAAGDVVRWLEETGR